LPELGIRYLVAAVALASGMRGRSSALAQYSIVNVKQMSNISWEEKSFIADLNKIDRVVMLREEQYRNETSAITCASTPRD
jgi:hypothetical protein